MFNVNLMVTTKNKTYHRYKKDKEKGVKAYQFKKKN